MKPLSVEARLLVVKSTDEPLAPALSLKKEKYHAPKGGTSSAVEVIVTFAM